MECSIRLHTGEDELFGILSARCDAKIDVLSVGQIIDRQPKYEDSCTIVTDTALRLYVGREKKYLVHIMSMDIDAPVSIAHRPTIPQSSAT